MWERAVWGCPVTGASVKVHFSPDLSVFGDRTEATAAIWACAQHRTVATVCWPDLHPILGACQSKQSWFQPAQLKECCKGHAAIHKEAWSRLPWTWEPSIPVCSRLLQRLNNLFRHCSPYTPPPPPQKGDTFGRICFAPNIIWGLTGWLLPTPVVVPRIILLMFVGSSGFLWHLRIRYVKCNFESSLALKCSRNACHPRPGFADLHVPKATELQEGPPWSGLLEVE